MTAAELELVLKPGDVLLYSPRGIFGWLIAVKTWHATSHVEVYIGNGLSVASRDGIGVDIYPLRVEQIQKICRQRGKMKFDAAAGLKWFIQDAQGKPYGWLDLFAFVGINIDGPGMICSTFATEFVRACGTDPFNGEDSKKIAPFQFALSPVFRVLDPAALLVPAVLEPAPSPAEADPPPPSA